MPTRTYTKEDVVRGLSAYNEVMKQYGFPSQTLAGIGFTENKGQDNDVVIGVEQVIHVPGLYIEVVLQTVDASGHEYRRLKRIEFKRPLIVLVVLNGNLLFYRQFRHGVSGPRLSTLRGWSAAEDQSHEARVKYLVRERLGEAFLREIHDPTIVRIADVDEDDAVRAIPTDIYALIQNNVNIDALPRKHGGNKFHWIDLEEARADLARAGPLRALRTLQAKLIDVRGGQTLAALEALNRELVRHLDGGNSVIGQAIFARQLSTGTVG